MSLYIRPSSPQYEYARRVAAGEEPLCVSKRLGIEPGKARVWRYRLRRDLLREEGVNAAYPIAAMLALLPRTERKMIIAILYTHALHDFAQNA